MLRRQTVPNIHHHAAAHLAKLSAEGVVACDVMHDKAAAVEIDECWISILFPGRINSHGNSPARTGNHRVLYVKYLRRPALVIVDTICIRADFLNTDWLRDIPCCPLCGIMGGNLRIKRHPHQLLSYVHNQHSKSGGAYAIGEKLCGYYFFVI